MFRFAIRDVLWLTVVVALAVGWWANRASLLKDHRSIMTYQRRVAVERAELERELAILRLQVLREKELQGKVILPSSEIRAAITE